MTLSDFDLRNNETCSDKEKEFQHIRVSNMTMMKISTNLSVEYLLPMSFFSLEGYRKGQCVGNGEIDRVEDASFFASQY